MVIFIRRKTHEVFLQETMTKHPNLHVLGKYVNGRTKIDLHCNICGVDFSAVPSSLYMGHGCPNCAGVMKYTTEKFVARMKEISPDITVLGEYVTSKTKIQVSCGVCGGIWEAIPNSLLKGRGCPHCSPYTKKTHEKFVEQMGITHPELIVLGEYKNNKTKVLCKCKECGHEFMGSPHSMLDSGHGCTKCGLSHGERKVQQWLDKNGFSYILEYTFSDCRDKLPLPFDFFLPSMNTIIEYDGRQHFEVSEFFGGEESFKTLKRHDDIKNDYCLHNRINLIRIPYWDFKNIDEILTHKLAS